jgi:hypothetical protein
MLPYLRATLKIRRNLLGRKFLSDGDELYVFLCAGLFMIASTAYLVRKLWYYNQPGARPALPSFSLSAPVLLTIFRRITVSEAGRTRSFPSSVKSGTLSHLRCIQIMRRRNWQDRPSTSTSYSDLDLGRIFAGDFNSQNYALKSSWTA